MTFGICVFACRPSSVSRPSASGSSSARCENRCASATKRSSPVIAPTVGEHLVHAAVFAVEHLLEVDRRARPRWRRTIQSRELARARRARACCRDAGARRAGRPAPCAVVYQGTPGEGLAREAVGQRRDAVGKGREPAARLRLALRQLGDDVVDAFGEAHVARGLEHAGRGREVVAERVAVAADFDPRLDRLPAAVHRCLGWQARRSRGSCAACGLARAAVDRRRRVSARRGTAPARAAPRASGKYRGVLRKVVDLDVAAARMARTRTTPHPRRESSARPGACAARSSLRPPGARRCTSAPAASPTSSRRPWRRRASSSPPCSGSRRC